ncbi:hypothetical protein ACFE04_015208 [Oxalis oulophora]
MSSSQNSIQGTSHPSKSEGKRPIDPNIHYDYMLSRSKSPFRCRMPLHEGKLIIKEGSSGLSKSLGKRPIDFDVDATILLSQSNSTFRCHSPLSAGKHFISEGKLLTMTQENQFVENQTESIENNDTAHEDTSDDEDIIEVNQFTNEGWMINLIQDKLRLSAGQRLEAASGQREGHESLSIAVAGASITTSPIEDGTRLLICTRRVRPTRSSRPNSRGRNNNTSNLVVGRGWAGCSWSEWEELERGRSGLAQSTKFCFSIGQLVSCALKTDSISSNTTPNPYTSLFMYKCPAQNLYVWTS